MCPADVPVFRPTLEEFSNFAAYIETIEAAGAPNVGLAKVIPPPEWRPCDPCSYENPKIRIRSPITQIVTGRNGLYQLRNTCLVSSMSISDFRKLAFSPQHATPNYKSLDELERLYWEALPLGGAVYGADTPGSLFDSDVRSWNINRLGTILDLVKTTDRKKIEGVTTPYLYFGMWKATFAWHTEDMDLHSINYLHFGQPKFWYVVSPEYGARFEHLVATMFPQTARACSAFMRHKTIAIAPHILREHDIPYSTVMHKAGEFMITFPYAYHCGFNVGYNCAESTNFANIRWINFGMKANLCSCSADAVRIEMAPFVKRFLPDEYAKLLGQEQADCRTEESENLENVCQPDFDGLKRQPYAISFKEEKNRNAFLALTEPHCVLCQLFVSRILAKRMESIPQRSRRVVSDFCFQKNDLTLHPGTTSKKDIETDLLLVCSVCDVVVHAGCYNAKLDRSEVNASWKCDRCSDVNEQVVCCVLCGSSGEAFNRTSDGQWVHLSCALLTSKVRFDFSTTARTVVDVTDALSSVPKLVCTYCTTKIGRPVVCCYGTCNTTFHVSCGWKSGVTFEIRDWPQLAVAMCCNHVATSSADERPVVSAGERVVAQCSGSKFSYGVVKSVGEAVFCAVDFDDGSFSNGIFISTVESCECSGDCLGAHQNGARVQVRWIDKKLYGGTFRRAYHGSSYRILLDDGQLIDCMREEVYGPGEILPEHVKRKLRKRMFQ
uniref:[histone H3]-trimethyl-L-lysine(9) demethylase n=1 Tax=Trichuris muris TaxID=70415 RepID=A0A5S6QGK0_TRIMR